MTTEAPSQAQLANQMFELLARFQTFTKQQKDWLAGTPTGGPEGDGRYPLTDYLGATYLIPCPALDSARVAGEVDSARDYAAQASSSVVSAQTYLTQSAQARDIAGEFAQAALAARDLAKVYADQAGSHAANAYAYAAEAAASAELSKVDLEALANSVAASAASAEESRLSASASRASADDASGSATAAAGSAEDASTSAAQAATFNPGNFAPIGGVTGDFNVGGNFLVKGGNSLSRSATSAANASYWLQDASGRSRAAIFWDNPGDLLRLRKYDSNGAGHDIAIDNTGSLSVEGSGSFGSQLYSSHLYPLLEFRQPGKPLTQGEGFVGSWNGDTMLRSWPSGVDHTKHVELFINQSLGRLGLRDATGAMPFKATMGGAVTLTGGLSGYEMVARDGQQTWATYATGNQYRVWNSYNSVDVFKVGMSGDAYISNGNGGGSLQIGDDARLVDVNIGSTLGLQSLSNGNYGFLKFGANGARVGHDGAGLWTDGSVVRGIGSGNAGYVWHEGNFGTSNWVGNYNNLLKSGFYRINDGNSNQNFPVGAAYGQMWVSSGGAGDTTVQIACAYNSSTNSNGQMYWRGCHNSGANWHRWRTVWDDNNLIVSSGDPGYIEGRIWIQI